jgi:hypothetical protein
MQAGVSLAQLRRGSERQPKALDNTARSIHGLGEAYQLFLNRKSELQPARHPGNAG